MYENLDNSAYPVSPDTGGLTQLGNISSSDIEVENKWSQFMSHDTSFSFPAQSQYGTILYPPSKVNLNYPKENKKSGQNDNFFIY